MIVSLLISWFMNIKRPRLMLRISLFCLIINLAIFIIFLNLNTSTIVMIISAIAVTSCSVALFSTIVALIRIPFCKEESPTRVYNIFSIRNLIYTSLLPIILFLIFYLLKTKSDEIDGLAKQTYKHTYIAVQFEEGDNWSIIDCNGKIIVNEEYSPDDFISPITPDGTYWVKSFIDEKYRFYSIKSPHRPISTGEYISATVFFNNYSFVSDGKNPIQSIGTDGSVKKTLAKEIHRIYLPEQTGNRILYEGKNGLYGYLNNTGDIVIKAQYHNAEDFCDGVAIVKRNDDEIIYIIDENGKELGKIDTNRYNPVSYLPKYSDGLLATLESNYKLTYLDKKGNVAFVPKINYHKSEHTDFVDGYAVISDEQEKGVGVIDKEGKTVIRLGKYNKIANMGNGTFAVINKKGKIGIVDAEDNVMIDCNYDELLKKTIAGNYVMKKNDFWYFVTPDGERINNIKAYNIETRRPQSVAYHNPQKIAEDLVSQISTKGYKPIIGKTKVTEIAELYGLKAEEQCNNVRYIELPKFKVDAYDATPYVNFNNYVIIEKTHTETLNDGWFSYEETISDGWGWNDDAILDNIYIELSGVSYMELEKEIGKKLEEKGFELIEQTYEARNGDKYIQISICRGREGFGISIDPYNESSVKDEYF